MKNAQLLIRDLWSQYEILYGVPSKHLVAHHKEWRDLWDRTLEVMKEIDEETHPT